jgi:hypothetical protein
LRTFVQAFTGVILAQVGAIAVDAQQGKYVLDIDWLKRILISALVAGIIALVTFAQNWSEDAGVVPSVLKAKASSGADPVTTDPIK